MSYTNDDQYDFTYKGPRDTLIACAVGFGQQPVLCNIVSLEPLFYIEDEDYDDDIMIDETSGLMGDMFANREELIKRKHAFDYVDSFEKLDVKKLLASEKLHIEDTTSPSLNLSDLTAVFAKSYYGQALLSHLDTQMVEIKLATFGEKSCYDRLSRTIFIRENLSKENALAELAKSARLAWHHTQGVLIHPLSFDPEDGIVINRVLEADLAATQTRIAWDLKLANEADLWDMLAGGSAFTVCSALAREAVTDFRTLNNGQAHRALFEQWFLSGRCKTTDRVLIQQMLKDQNGYVFDNDQIIKNLTKDVICRLGDSPVGKNYLSPILGALVADPMFTEVRDRTNANFLWFIKFEKSFRKSEQELQPSVGETSTSHRSSLNGQTEKQEIAHEKDSSVVAFKPRHAHGDAKLTGTDNQATIYYLDHFFGVR